MSGIYMVERLVRTHSGHVVKEEVIAKELSDASATRYANSEAHREYQRAKSVEPETRIDPYNVIHLANGTHVEFNVCFEF